MVNSVVSLPRSAKVTVTCAFGGMPAPQPAGSLAGPSYTSFSFSTTSLNTPRQGYLFPSGPSSMTRNLPPGRRSISHGGALKPLGPHQDAMWPGSVHAFQSSSRGASNTREMTISRSATNSEGVFAGCCFMIFSSFASRSKPRPEPDARESDDDQRDRVPRGRKVHRDHGDRGSDCRYHADDAEDYAVEHRSRRSEDGS